MLRTTIAGSLPKPGWLAETEKLWPAWRLEGAVLAEAKRDAILAALKMQETAASPLRCPETDASPLRCPETDASPLRCRSEEHTSELQSH